MFVHLSVILFPGDVWQTHIPRADTPLDGTFPRPTTPRQTSPQADTPWVDKPFVAVSPWQTHPPEQTPPDSPPPGKGRYASYWNAFL